MAVDQFLSSVAKLTEGSLALGEVIAAADGLRSSGNADLAIQLYHLWVLANPGSPLLYAALFNQAVIMTACGRLADAGAALEKAIEANPEFYPSYINLGSIKEQLGSPEEALGQWQKLTNKLSLVSGNAVAMKATALKQIARVLEGTNRLSEAESVLCQSLELDGSQRENVEHYLAARLAQCKWPVVAPFEGADSDTLKRGFSPLSLAVYTDDPLFQLAHNSKYSSKAFGSLIPRVPPLPAEPGEKTRLRIGYVSSDLKAHAIGYLTADLYGLHDRSQFEVFAYYCGPAGDDAIKRKIQASVDHWKDITSMPDAAVAGLIQADRIDILIDLNGHTKGARTKVFGMRPAPIGVNWLGYPGTMGTPYHHYIIADDWIIPPGNEIYVSEKVVRLPCYQPNYCNRPVSDNPPQRSDVGLPDGAMVFCCFNGLQKVNKSTFERWAHIVASVPGSVLWILEGHADANARLADLFEANGIDRGRLVFARSLPSPDHLARLALADLFLDTFPYGAHTTASDALWMGVPVVTLSGKSFASRVCGSLARSAGLAELVCDTPEQYVNLAIELGTNRETLARYRDRLQTGRDSSVLFDTAGLVRHLEDLYRGMWADYVGGNLPQPDLYNLDSYYDIGLEHRPEEVPFLSDSEYRAQYRNALAQRHDFCPIRDDGRLWTAPFPEDLPR